MKKNVLFYGWWIVAVAFWANFLSVGTGFYIFNATMEPLCELRGWTRTQVNGALVLGSLIGFASQLLYGTLVMRFGPRLLMLFGTLAAGIAAVFAGRVTHLWLFYLCYMCLFLGNGAYGGIVANTVVSNWFVLKRGRAMGLATTAISLSGAVVPLAAMVAIQEVGLTAAFAIMGVVMALFGPVAWLVVRDWPEDSGLLPDGVPPGEHESFNEIPSEPKNGPDPLEWPLSRLIRLPAFWKTGFSFALVMVGVVGVMSQLKPRFSDLGFSHMTAMTMMAATALLGAGGKYYWGMLCDRFPAQRVVGVLMAANAVGLGLGLFAGNGWLVYAFICVFGFSMGGVMSTFPVMAAYLFGRRSFAAVLRFMALFLTLQLAGYLIAGQSFDRTGSYDGAYTFFIVLDLAAAGLMFSVKKPA